MSNLFISHSSRDAAAARELQARLEQQGHRSIFLDLDPDAGIQAGTSWERTLYTKLRACRAVVALCSENYLASQWCFAEVALARMEGKDLFVLQIDPWGAGSKMPLILTEEQTIDLRTDPEEGYRRLWNGLEVKGIVAAEAREWKPQDPPYPGLRAFGEEDAPIFFGRDQEIRDGGELLNRVRRQGHPRLVMVLGSSGSGKSSLVRAGIVPQLRRDRGQWLVVRPFRPGRQPAREAAAALSEAFADAGQALGWEEILRWLEPAADDGPAAAATGPSRITETGPAAASERLLQALSAMESELSAADEQVASSVRRLKAYLGGRFTASAATPGLAPAPAGASALAELATRLRLLSGSVAATVVLVIDQFEELLGHDEAHPASRFLVLLRTALDSEDSPLVVLGTMRSDYLGVLQRSAPVQGLGFGSLSVGPVSREGMRQIIEEPARLGQVQLEKGLPDLLLDDTQTSDALPLLAFTLRMMWDRFHDRRVLELREYRAIGGLQGAMAQVADETFDAALEQVKDPGERDAMARALRDAFLGMARPAVEGAGWARQAMNGNDLVERVRPMVAKFIDQRLLLRRADGTVEVAHEALFRSWSRLRGWLDENAEGLRLLSEIGLDATNWAQAATAEDKASYLWRGGRLARALELRERGVLPLKEGERSFVDASDRAARAQAEAEEARRRRQLRRTRIVAAVIGVAFLVTLASFFFARDQQQRAQDRALLAVASDQVDKDPTRAALVLLELSRPDRSPGAVALMSQALQGPLALRELIAHRELASSIAYSPDGSLLATASTDGTARLWTEGGEAVLDGKGEAVVLRHGGEVATVAFSPDGKRLVTASFDRTARVWAAAGGPPLFELVHPKAVNAAAYSPRGDRIATACDDGLARVWPADGSGEPLLLDHEGEDVMSVAWNPSGDRLVTATRGHRAWLWRLEGPGQPQRLEGRLEGHEGDLEGATFSSDGTQVVTASVDGSARVWRVEPADFGKDGVPAPAVLEHGKGVKVYRALFLKPAGGEAGAGNRVVTAATDGRIRLWTADGESYQPAVIGRGAIPMWIDLDPRGGRFAIALVDGRAQVWRLARGAEPRQIDQAKVQTARFTTTGILTTAGDGLVRVWSQDRDGRSVVLPLPSWGRAGAIAGAPAGVPLELTGNEGAVVQIEVAPGGGRVFMAARDGKVRLWDGEGSPGAVLDHAGKRQFVRAAWSPAADRIVTAGDDGRARVWHADGKPVLAGAGPQVGMQHGGPILGAAFSPDGTRIATASQDGSVRIWNADGSPIAAARASSDAAADPQGAIVLQHAKAVHAVAWSPGGDRLVTASADFNARVWRLDGRAPVRLKGHTAEVIAAAFSPDGRRVVTGARDGTARVWHADGSGDALVLPGGPGEWVTDAVFGPLGQRVSTASRGGHVGLWLVSHDLLAQRIRSETQICLDPGFRQQTLGESPSQAERDYRRCQDCRDAFRGRMADGLAEQGIGEYRRCLQPARYLQTFW